MKKIDWLKNRVYNMDCRNMVSLPDNSIDCFVSSPPYYLVRDYEIPPIVWDGDTECEHEWEDSGINFKYTGGKTKGYVGNFDSDKTHFEAISSFCKKCGAWLGQLGQEPNYNLFIKHLCDIYDIVKQKLKPTGTVWVNLGDTYSSGGKVVETGRHDTEKSESFGGWSCWDGGNTKIKIDNDVPAKCLYMIPQRFAIEMVNRGWILRNVVIWCLSSKTQMFVKINDEYKLLPLRRLKELFGDGDDVKFFLPTSYKGDTKWVKLKNIYNSSETEGYKITLTNGLSITATKNHVFPVKSSAFAKNNPDFIKLSFKKTNDIKVGDYLYINTKFDLEENDYSYSYNDGLALGIYIAEGSYLRTERYNKGTEYSKYALERWRKEKGFNSISEYLENRNDISGIALAHNDVDFIEKLNFDIKTYKYDCYVHHSYDKNYLKLIKKFLSGHNAYTKRLNNCVWNTNKMFLKGILDGYLQGDGHNDIKNNRWRIGFTSKNPYLMNDLMMLCKVLGYDIRKQRTNNVSTKGQLRIEWNRNMFKNLLTQRVKKIEKIKGHKFYDIEVEPILSSKSKWNNLFCVANGILTHNSKPNAMPQSVKDRMPVDFEYVYFFVKSRKYFYDREAIREEISQTATNLQRRMYKPGDGTQGVYAKNDKVFSMNQNEKSYWSDGKYKRCVWTVNTKASPVKHYATYPVKLIEDMIKAGCPERICKECGKPLEPIYEEKSNPNREDRNDNPNPQGTHRCPGKDYSNSKVFMGYEKCKCGEGWKRGIVCDPFGGIGTTARAAIELERDWIIFDLSKDYSENANMLIKQKIEIENAKKHKGVGGFLML